MTTEENEQIHATLAKLIAETGKLNAETAKLNTEARYHPFTAVALVLGATAATFTAFGALLLKVFGG